MRATFALFAGLLAFLLQACAIHPLPENVVGLDTNHIVYYIRCEARDAVVTAFARYLAGRSEDHQIGEDLLSGRRKITELKASDLSPPARAAIEKYLPAAIAFDFTFDMSEDGNLTTQVDLLNTFTHSALSLGLTGGSDHQRQTIRNFRTSSTFNDLIGKFANCGGPREPNWNYPIAGNIGLAEMVTTFIDLNQFEGLTGAKDSVPQLADTLVFQTNLTGSALPKIVLNPLKHGAQVSDAMLTGSVFRKDTHKVIVGLSLPPSKPGAIKFLAGSFFGSAIGSSSAAFSQSSAQLSANALIDEQVQRNIINNLARPQQY